MIRRLRLRRLSFVIMVACSLIMTPTSGEASAQLDPISLSFPSYHLGYVLSFYDCAGRTCAALRGTNDGASTWSVVPTPNQLNKDLNIFAWGNYSTSYVALTVHFADAEDGWIYGTVPAPATSNTSNPNLVNRLWSTHDRGETWQQVRLGALSIAGGVIQMATHGHWTYLFGQSDESGQDYILATRSNMDHWTSKSSAAMEGPAGGTQLQGEFSFIGSDGWFLAGNDRGTTASARLSKDGLWNDWSGSSLSDFAASFSPIATVTGTVLLAEGESPEIVIPPASSVPPNWNNGVPWLFISYDGGTTFKPFRELSRLDQRGFSIVPGLPAMPAPGTILLQRATNSGVQIIRSTNWGRTWQVVLGQSVSQLVFTSSSHGFAIVRQQSSQTYSSLFESSDGGDQWSHVSM